MPTRNQATGLLLTLLALLGFLLFLISSASGAERLPVHRVVGVDEPARLVLDGGEVATISLGVVVENGQEFRIGAGGSVRVVCGSGHPLRLEEGLHELSCPPGTPVMTYQGLQVVGVRATGGLHPVVLSPRRTAVRTPRPDLRWRAPAQAEENDEYQIRLLAGATEVWRTSVTGTKTPYPPSLAGLKPGLIYRVEVLHGGHSSNEEDRAGLGFWRIPESKAREIADHLEAVDRIAMKKPVRDLITAQLLASQSFRPDGSRGGHGLYAEAIDLLQHNHLPAAQELLGELYLRVELPREARHAWLTAIRGYEMIGEVHREAHLTSRLRALGSTESPR